MNCRTRRRGSLSVSFKPSTGADRGVGLIAGTRTDPVTRSRIFNFEHSSSALAPMKRSFPSPPPPPQPRLVFTIVTAIGTARKGRRRGRRRLPQGRGTGTTPTLCDSNDPTNNNTKSFRKYRNARLSRVLSLLLLPFLFRLVPLTRTARLDRSSCLRPFRLRNVTRQRWPVRLQMIYGPFLLFHSPRTALIDVCCSRRPRRFELLLRCCEMKIAAGRHATEANCAFQVIGSGSERRM